MKANLAAKLIGSVIAFAQPVLASADDTIVLLAAAHTPFLKTNNGKLSGTAFKTVQCVLNELKRDFSVQLAPPKRMMTLAENGQIDGYFLSVVPGRTSGNVKPSAPLALEKWYWVQKTGSPLNPGNENDIRSASVGTLLGGNELDFLKKVGAANILAVAESSNLLSMIRLGRIDATVMNLQVFAEAAGHMAENSRIYDVYFLKYTPLVAVFSEKFLKKNKTFLADFNKAIPSCLEKPFSLTVEERVFLEAHVVERIKDLVSSPDIVSALKEQNEKHSNLSEAAIFAMDSKWKTAQTDVEGAEIVANVSKNKVSNTLKDFKAEARGLYSEIFVTDNKGLNLAMSDETSDYWQGDEEKFKRTFIEGPDGLFIDDIKFDASSLKFQVQISLTITDRSRNPIGSITAGVDVEAALQGLHLNAY